MITGFNTDIEFEGKTYHVQTEDKGLERPIVMSLIYDRGTILASKRTSYEDIIVDAAVDEDVLAERLQKQHRLICAAVRTGRINDLIKMNQKPAADAVPAKEPVYEATQTVEAEVEAISEASQVDVPDEIPDEIQTAMPVVPAAETIFFSAPADFEPSLESAPALSIPAIPTVAPPANPSSFSMPDLDLGETASFSENTGIADILALPFVPPVVQETSELSQPVETFAEITTPPIPMSSPASEHAAVTKPLDLDLTSASTQAGNPFDVVEDEILFADEIESVPEILLPEEAVEIVSEMIGKERPSNTRLTIELLGDSRFRGGEHKSVNLMVCRGSDRRVVNDANVMVKILGSSFRPMIFHAKTDQNGLAKVNLQFPSFAEGRAALLVRVIADGEEVELRRVVAHG